MKLKALFISSGNSISGVNPIIENQGNSLSTFGIEVDYFTITGKGILSYLNHVKILKNFLKDRRYDVFHAHYSYSAFTASLAGCKPLVVSLMGSDVYSGFFGRQIIKIFNLLFWEKIIVKSERMKDRIRISSSEIVPNGVNLAVFRPEEKQTARRRLSLEKGKKYLLFAANPERVEKNYKLAKEAHRILGDKTFEILVVYKLRSGEMPDYINSSDVVLLTSDYEGSANIIKEAMACNKPVVSTDVGDASSVLDKVEGCFIADSNALDIAEKIVAAITFQASDGRQRIVEKELDSESIAEKIHKIYLSVK